MYLIVGLGNPEPEYSFTRHNVGFDVINKLADKYQIKITKSGFKAIYGTGTIENKSVVLFKPQTYMNLSGDAIIEAINYYKTPLKNVIIIYDDIDIPTGTIRLRKKGGPRKSQWNEISCTKIRNRRFSSNKNWNRFMQ